MVFTIIHSIVSVLLSFQSIIFSIIYYSFISIFVITFNKSYHACVMCSGYKAEYVCLAILDPTAMGQQSVYISMILISANNCVAEDNLPLTIF